MATPRLRGPLAVNAAVAAAGSMVLVNTVVIVQASLGLSERAAALALASFSAGSMLAALLLPRVLERWADRNVMLGGVALMVAGLFLGAWATGFAALIVLWFGLGLGYSTAQTPFGRLLRRSSHPEDRLALFAAQFALSHAGWFLFYPFGWLARSPLWYDCGICGSGLRRGFGSVDGTKSLVCS